MLQIYLLVVAINALMGVVIILGKFADDSSQSFLHGNTFTLTLTIISCVIAVASLIAPYGQGGIGTLPLLGDLFPTLITFAGYLVFLTRYIRQNYPDKIETNNFFITIEANEYYIGIACLAVATIHFLFPAMLFL
ncbi:MAG: hypothetical protein ACTTJ3_03760 [Treponema sp.]